MQEQPKRKGIPFLRKIFFLFILLVVLASIGLWYVNENIMPTKGKSLIIDYLTKATGREVTLESVYYNPFRGIVLRNLAISDDPKYKRKFLEVGKLYLNILYIPLLQQKKLVISSVRIDSPKMAITIDDQDKWNFQSLAFLNQPKSEGGDMTTLVNSVIISNARIALEDLATAPAFRKELKDTDLQVSLSYPLKIKYRLNSRLDIKQANFFSADGQYDPVKKSATLNLKLKDIPLAEFQPYYAEMPFKTLAGNLSGNISASYSHENSLTVATVSSVTGLNLGREDYTAKGAVDLSGKMSLDLRDKTKAKIPCVINAAAKLARAELVSKDFSVKGDVDANGKFTFDLKDKGVPLKYTADTQLRDTKLTGVPVFGVIDRINGKIYFDETKLWTDLLKGLTKGFDCVFSGTVKDYTNPHLDLTAKTSLDLARLNELLTPEMKEKLKDYTFSGISKLSLNVNGMLKQQDKVPLAYVVTSELLDCGVKAAFLDKPVKSINGKLVVKQDSMALKDISAFFNDKKYFLSGEITNFKTPVCDLSLSSDDLKLKMAFKYLEDSVTFGKFDGRYRDTVFNLAGSYANFKDPAVSVKGTVVTRIGEISRYLPKENAEFFNKLNPATSLSSSFEFKGKTKKQETWDLLLNKFEGKSSAVDLAVFGSISDFKDPLLDVRGSLDTTFEELKKFMPPQQAEMLTKSEVDGDVALKFVFKGRQKAQDTWQADLIADSPQINIKKLKFAGCHLETKFKDKFLTFPRVTANPYDGTLAANAVIDFSQQNPQYVVQVAVRDIDISRWKNDTEAKDKNLQGRFSANADLGGFGSNLETLKGKGRFEIKDGHFWELPVFSGIANILYIPGVSNIVFGEARGTFSIANKKVYTEDTRMISEQMSLTGNGSMDFDGKLDFQITATFDKGLLQVASPLGPFRDFLIDKEGNYLGNITLSGTTKEPKFDPKFPSLNKILQNKLFNNIKNGIFGGEE
ncbi:MAG: AsmA family protein [Candidatus Omnitrophica bacterium]|nr:AsmA family protein [Candidatus Omnitrophota bacterium]